jgi:DNA mismatch repair protein MutS2
MATRTLELLEWSRVREQLATFATTKLGSLAAQVLLPPEYLEVSQHLLQETTEVYTLEEQLLGGLSLDGVQDIGNSLERAERQGVLEGKELLAIATTLNAARQLRRTIEKYPDFDILNAWVSQFRTYPDLEQAIHHSIDDQGEVTERASTTLASIRDRQRRVRQEIQSILQGLIQRKASALQEPIITQRSDRFVVPVKAPQKDQVPGVVHDASGSGATLYIEPQATVNLNNQLRVLARQEREEIERICRALTEKVAAVGEDLNLLLEILTQLDLAIARARYSYWLKGTPPVWVDNGEVNLRQLRHPLLLWQEAHESGSAVTPSDITIRSGVKVVAITGPNTGGKTVALKNLGLAVLLAKVGIFLPAREPARLPWFDQVLADIGDEQSLQQSLSTFSGHIRRIQTIVETLTPQSLVLLDEVGAGTDPSEGSALAIALLQHLADTAQLTLATTHFSDLKSLKYQDERFENASVEFNDETLAPTYRLLWGIPGRSNALIIAKRLGLRQDIIDQAQLRIQGQVSELNEVIADLEEQRRTQEAKNKEASYLLQHTEFLHRELEKQAATLKSRERELRQQQEQSVQESIQAARAEIAAVIRKLQQGPQIAHAAQQATEQLQSIAQKHRPAQQVKSKVGFRPQVGDRIRLVQLGGQTAEVISTVDDEGELSVRLGMMKLTVNLSDIESLTGEKAELISKPPKTTVSPPPEPEPLQIRTSQNTIDIRGQRVADAEVVLENAIANAHGPIWIIHGHGTGALRRGVQEFLKQHPGVERFELAEQSDGGSGVTIAYCVIFKM